MTNRMPEKTCAGIHDLPGSPSGRQHECAVEDARRGVAARWMGRYRAAAALRRSSTGTPGRARECRVFAGRLDRRGPYCRWHPLPRWHQMTGRGSPVRWTSGATAGRGSGLWGKRAPLRRQRASWHSWRWWAGTAGVYVSRAALRSSPASVSEAVMLAQALDDLPWASPGAAVVEMLDVGAAVRHHDANRAVERAEQPRCPQTPSCSRWRSHAGRLPHVRWSRAPRRLRSRCQPTRRLGSPATVTVRVKRGAARPRDGAAREVLALQIARDPSGVARCDPLLARIAQEQAAFQRARRARNHRAKRPAQRLAPPSTAR